MFSISQQSRNITYKILPTVSKCGLDILNKSIHIYSRGASAINYTTGAGNPLFYFFPLLFLSFPLSLY